MQMQVAMIVLAKTQEIQIAHRVMVQAPLVFNAQVPVVSHAGVNVPVDVTEVVEDAVMTVAGPVIKDVTAVLHVPVVQILVILAVGRGV